MTLTSGLPQLNGQQMTCGGGFETWLQYVDGFELRHFCAFELLNDPRGRECLESYHRKLIEAAVVNGFGVINEGLHYRASSDWGALIGFSPQELEEINIRGVEFYRNIAEDYDTPETPMTLGGVIGPRGDAYNVGRTPTVEDSEEYHSEQIATFKRAGVDQITAATFSFVDEAIGLARAAKALDMPVVISFFVAKGGKLKSGMTLEEAIATVDAATDSAPAYYMINCTHPTEFENGLTDGDWSKRLGGFMPNAVAMETLDLCKLGHLEDGDPQELGGQMADIARRFPHINVWGGCCGTDGRHINEITRQVRAVREAEPAPA